MNNQTSTHDAGATELFEDLEPRQDRLAPIDRAFLWLIRVGIVAIVCFTVSAIVHDVYLTSVIAHLA